MEARTQAKTESPAEGSMEGQSAREEALRSGPLDCSMENYDVCTGIHTQECVCVCQIPHICLHEEGQGGRKGRGAEKQHNTPVP